MTDDTAERRREWTLTTDSLQRLLRWLDGGADSDGYSYVEMRRRLRDYFARKNCPAVDDLADETLTRVARRLEEEGITLAETPARYCYIVARFVFLEHLRETKSHGTISPLPADVPLAGAPRQAGGEHRPHQRRPALAERRVLVVGLRGADVRRPVRPA